MGNEIAVQSQQDQTPSLPPLVRLALEGRGWVKTPDGMTLEPLSSDVKAALGALERELTGALVPATKPAIVLELARLGVHFWQPDRPQKHTEIMLEDYAKDMGHLPADLVARSCEKWRKTGKFWPKVSELLELADPIYRARKAMLARVSWHLRPTWADKPKQQARDDGPRQIGAVVDWQPRRQA